MDKEDLHIVFQGFQIVLSFFGFLIIIFKGGRYIGSTDTKLEKLIEDNIEVKVELNKHQVDDKEIQSDILEKLTGIRIDLASLKSKPNFNKE